MYIGFFDSGVGGLTVLHEALNLLPNENYLYYADTRHVPYGEKPKEQVKQYVFDAVEFMAGQGMKALVIACNTATSIAAADLRQKYSFPIIGMEPAVKPAVEKNTNGDKRVLVFATELTLKEEKFKNLVAQVDAEHLVDFLPLPGLVTYAENLQFDRDIVVPYLNRALARFNLDNYSTVVLGCTHFTFFRDSLKQILPAGIELIDGNLGTVRQLERVLNGQRNNENRKAEIAFFASGEKLSKPEELAKFQGLLTRLG